MQEYAPPRTVDAKAARQRRNEALAVIPHELEIATGADLRARAAPAEGGRRNTRSWRSEREFDSGARAALSVLREFHRLPRYRAVSRSSAHAPAASASSRAASVSSTCSLTRAPRPFTRQAAARRVDDCRHVAHVRRVGEAQSRVERAGRSRSTASCRRIASRGSRSSATSARRWDLMFIDPPTHSRSKRMTEDFDVQRDHVQLLTSRARIADAAWHDRVLQQLHALQARCARRSRHLKSRTSAAIQCREDFARNPRIHSCFLLRCRAV